MVVLPVLGTGKSLELRNPKIIAVGLNYRDHVAESPSILAKTTAPTPEEPKEPILFAKTPNVLIGPGEPIPIPQALLAGYGFAECRTDYEAELAVVMGERCKNVDVAHALSAVLGYTCFNDVSQRNFQKSDRSGWFRGKSLDGFGPIGPVIVPASALPDPQKLAISCRRNGKTVQSSTTAEMIFSVATLIAFISRHMTLEPGDIIATGTPSGVGPIKPGDVVEIEIEGIGILSNPVVSA
ncbi:MAG: fumarylacetoacetate hydrolase family protein [Spirochaetaceae bacterium]|nr:fumarylacetoacetate hydrolase family protein [Spirochaetaceae bacterium]